jgi:hypothetical protein
MKIDQIRLIDKHLRVDNWLTDSVLIDELIGHYIAAIDERMNAGQSVDEALKAICEGFGGRKGLVVLEARRNPKVSRNTLLILGIYMVAFNIILSNWGTWGWFWATALAGVVVYIYD